MRLSDRISMIEESETLKFTPLLEKLRKEGKKIIDFAVGELEFETPEEIIEATKKALDVRKTRYSNVSGISELKKAISNTLEKEIGYDEKNIIITNGSKHALSNIFQMLCNPDDEVIIPKPYWVSFPEQIKLAGAKPIFVDTVNNQLDIEKIKESLNNKTKAIVINSPNNPSGAVYKKDDLKAIAEMAVDNDFFIVSDEAYDMLIYDGLKHYSIASLNADARKRTIVVKSFSKPFSMTGFRVGYVIAEKDIVSSMNRLQGHTIGNVCTFAQYGALAALTMDKSIVNERISMMEKRRNLAYKLITKLFECIKPQGAFYLFPNVKDCLNYNIKTVENLAAHFLKKANVAVIPGKNFGVENHIRISYTAPEDEIKKGFEKMAEVL